MTANYEIRVLGQLPPDWGDWFGDATELTASAQETILRGDLDQAALLGILTRLFDLNLPLVAIQRNPSAPKDV